MVQGLRFMKTETPSVRFRPISTFAKLDFSHFRLLAIQFKPTGQNRASSGRPHRTTFPSPKGDPTMEHNPPTPRGRDYVPEGGTPPRSTQQGLLPEATPPQREAGPLPKGFKRDFNQRGPPSNQTPLEHRGWWGEDPSFFLPDGWMWPRSFAQSQKSKLLLCPLKQICQIWSTAAAPPQGAEALLLCE